MAIFGMATAGLPPSGASAAAGAVGPAIADTVRRQVEAGIDCVGDGEFWTARSLAHYTAHFTGIEAGPVAPGSRRPPATGHRAGRRPRPGQIGRARWQQRPARH